LVGAVTTLPKRGILFIYSQRETAYPIQRIFKTLAGLPDGSYPFIVIAIWPIAYQFTI
jgi:hypothetical protein